MDRPFDVIVVGLLQNQGTIAKEIVKGVTQFRELRSSFLFGGCGSHSQHQGDG